MAIMKKLNSLAQTQKQNKFSNQKNTASQVVNVTYGHDTGGKLYSYDGGNRTYRTGDIITPHVTNPISHKTYKTLAVVRSTHSANNLKQDTKNYLTERGIGLKTIVNNDQTALPGFKKRSKEYEDAGLGKFTTKQWEIEGKERAKQRYLDRLNMKKLTMLGVPTDE